MVFITLGFPLKSFPVVYSCLCLLLPIVGSDGFLTIRLVSEWTDLPCVHMAVELDVSR